MCARFSEVKSDLGLKDEVTSRTRAAPVGPWLVESVNAAAGKFFKQILGTEKKHEAQECAARFAASYHGVLLQEVMGPHIFQHLDVTMFEVQSRLLRGVAIGALDRAREDVFIV